MESVVSGVPSESIYAYKPDGGTSIGICTFPGTSIGSKTEFYYNINDNDIIQLLQ